MLPTAAQSARQAHQQPCIAESEPHRLFVGFLRSAVIMFFEQKIRIFTHDAGVRTGSGHAPEFLRSLFQISASFERACVGESGFDTGGHSPARFSQRPDGSLIPLRREQTQTVRQIDARIVWTLAYER